MSNTRKNRWQNPMAGSVPLSLAWVAGVTLAMGPGLVGQAAEGDAPVPDTTPRFTCQLDNGRYTVMYSPASEPGQRYAWAVPEDMGAAWPAERRCTTIASRLESYRPDGLVELQTGLENDYNTVCVTTEAVASCRIVFTVPQGQDPVATRDRVFNNLALADQGQRTDGVTTLTGNGSTVLDQLGQVLGNTGTLGQQRSSGINLKPFLDGADGGTGVRLGGSATPGRPLNPDNFR